ncbi:MAG: glycine cleavage system protein GcvH [Candidatus Thermoplasmatota archaeon]|nr:glycine cleavage system protein GcvH [Candidatus Thermoplasmatota archaeon]
MSEISDLKFIEGLKYTPTHEWARIEGDIAVVGITAYATHHLTDIVYVESPIVGENCEQFKELSPEGAVESVKASTPIYSPLSGEILEVNEDVINAPEKLNEDPYENWIYKMKIGDPSETSKLMDVDPYKAHCESEEH